MVGLVNLVQGSREVAKLHLETFGGYISRRRMFGSVQHFFQCFFRCRWRILVDSRKLRLLRTVQEFDITVSKTAETPSGRDKRHGFCLRRPHPTSTGLRASFDSCSGLSRLVWFLWPGHAAAIGGGEP